MNISKIGSMPFKGYLTIQQDDEVHTFNTEKIKSVTNSHKDKGVIIDGQEEPFSMATKILVPYSMMSANTVLAAYKAAKQSEKAEIILKSV